MKVNKEEFDKLQKLRHAYISDDGKEIVNPIPKEISLALDPPMSIEDRVARAVAWHISEAAERQEMETLRDAMDFDIMDDEVQIMSGYEIDDIPLANPDNLERSSPDGETDQPDPGPDPDDPAPENPADPVT